MKFCWIIVSFCALIACSAPQNPEFVKMEDVVLTDISGGLVSLNSKAVYRNPNTFGGTMKSTYIKVFVNEIEVGEIIQDEETDIPANGEFSIPLTISFPLNKVFNHENEKNLLKGVLNALLDRKAEVHYEGKANFDLAGIPVPVPISHDEEIKF